MTGQSADNSGAGDLPGTAYHFSGEGPALIMVHGLGGSAKH